MSITLDAITLPDDLIWTDEFAWSPLQQSKTYSLTGALILETGAMQAGRPITLAGSDDAAWITRAALKTLYAKLTTTASMSLALNDGRVFTVAFNHDDKPIEARPVFDYSTPADDDFYTLTLKLITL
jgi:hypothetical protein